MAQIDFLNMLSTAQIGFGISVIALLLTLYVTGVFRRDEPKKRSTRH